MGSAGFFIAAIAIFALAAASAGLYLYQRKGNGDSARLFAPRTRRLAYVERTALEGGRKLLLVRRDDVEHLILIGGPIDLVIESGIRAEEAARSAEKEAASAPDTFAPSAWPMTDFTPDIEPVAAHEPRLPVFPKEEKTLDLTPLPAVRAAE